MPQARSRPADISWKVCEQCLNLFAREFRSILSSGERWKPTNRVDDNLRLSPSPSSWPQNNCIAVRPHIECVARPQTQPFSNRTRQDHLPFGGNLGFHGKTILPVNADQSNHNRCHNCNHGRSSLVSMSSREWCMELLERFAA